MLRSGAHQPGKLFFVTYLCAAGHITLLSSAAQLRLHTRLHRVMRCGWVRLHGQSELEQPELLGLLRILDEQQTVRVLQLLALRCHLIKGLSQLALSKQRLERWTSQRAQR